jgi:thiamine pyrophosphokinase
VVVFSGGPVDRAEVRAAVAGLDPAHVIAADSGLHSVLSAGLRADVVVGDMDSVAPDLLERAVADGAATQVHPVDKDATDLELALDLALEVAAAGDEVVVVGSPSGRLDHLLAWACLVSSPRYRSLVVTGWLGSTRVLPVHDERTFTAPAGALVSLLALHGPVTGVGTRGLRWSPAAGTIEASSSLGVSNRMDAERATVIAGRGALTVVVTTEEG